MATSRPRSIFIMQLGGSDWRREFGYWCLLILQLARHVSPFSSVLLPPQSIPPMYLRGFVVPPLPLAAWMKRKSNYLFMRWSQSCKSTCEYFCDRVWRSPSDATIIINDQKSLIYEGGLPYKTPQILKENLIFQRNRYRYI